MIISFAWTIEPLLAGLKTCTRRARGEGDDNEQNH
jgi:hypothetical protein